MTKLLTAEFSTKDFQLDFSTKELKQLSIDVQREPSFTDLQKLIYEKSIRFFLERTLVLADHSELILDRLAEVKHAFKKLDQAGGKSEVAALQQLNISKNQENIDPKNSGNLIDLNNNSVTHIDGNIRKSAETRVKTSAENSTKNSITNIVLNSVELPKTDTKLALNELIIETSIPILDNDFIKNKPPNYNPLKSPLNDLEKAESVFSFQSRKPTRTRNTSTNSVNSIRQKPTIHYANQHVTVNPLKKWLTDQNKNEVRKTPINYQNSINYQNPTRPQNIVKVEISPKLPSKETTKETSKAPSIVSTNSLSNAGQNSIKTSTQKQKNYEIETRSTMPHSMNPLNQPQFQPEPNIQVLAPLKHPLRNIMKNAICQRRNNNEDSSYNKEVWRKNIENQVTGKAPLTRNQFNNKKKKSFFAESSDSEGADKKDVDEVRDSWSVKSQSSESEDLDIDNMSVGEYAQFFVGTCRSCFHNLF